MYTVNSLIHCVLPLAMANLRAALVAISSSNSGALAAGGGVGMPGCVVLVSNLNEKVCGCCHSLCSRQTTLHWCHMHH